MMELGSELSTWSLTPTLRVGDRGGRATELAHLIRTLCARPSNENWNLEFYKLFSFSFQRLPSIMHILLNNTDISVMSIQTGHSEFYRDHCLLLATLAVLGGHYDIMTYGTKITATKSSGSSGSVSEKKMKKKNSIVVDVDEDEYPPLSRISFYI